MTTDKATATLSALESAALRFRNALHNVRTDQGTSAYVAACAEVGDHFHHQTHERKLYVRRDAAVWRYFIDRRQVSRDEALAYLKGA